MNILDIINQIKNISSTNAKKDILEQHKNNEVLKRVLKMTLDPTIISGYKKLPLPEEGLDAMTLDEALTELEENIYNRHRTGYAGRDFIAKILGSVSPDDCEVLKKVLQKNLDAGIKEKNVNDVFGKNFIKDEPYMRCSLVDTKTIRNIKFNEYGYAVSEVKMDGQYLNHTVTNNNLLSTSRNGKVYDFLNCRDADMNILANNICSIDPRFSSGVVFNGEALMLEADGETIMPREKGNGIIQKAGKDSIGTDEAMRVVFVLWDVLPLDAFNAGHWDVSRKERRELLEKAVNMTNSTFVRMIEYKKVVDIDEAFDYNTEMMMKGEEGTVLKCESGFWKSHTSPTQLKMKLKMQVDLRITGFIEGEGKRKGVLGSLQLESMCGTLKVNCGTGIKEKDTEWTFDSIWKNKDKLIGTVVTVECNNLTVDKRTSVQKLFLPVFVEFRFDKDSCDDIQRIYEIKESAIMVFREALKNVLKG